MVQMGAGLFEIRAKGQEGIGRAFFCTVVGNEIVILHEFIKKTQKTHRKELDIARKRLKEVKQCAKYQGVFHMMLLKSNS